ncbi:porin family protein [Flavobacterium suncheonense]|uniref:Outer membrane protein beta-barrel domain-containing protein n=1 Tax=Flavobacterium suncheonense GH29-5 = DSM 17707 TaxID=1121899 RepID=A0A0A2M5K5_9FLAO|nr:outer membrane beta-barrel protein [Flavobacterium suncheonense]KGO86901.1 hypothetical protein Q764_13445 [Flavobacterium suncheonense GH29-5 = DSM 17707]
MKKLFLILGIGLLSLQTAKAQDQEIEIKPTPGNSWFKLGLTAGVPVGDANDVASFNAGLDVRAQYMVNPNFAIGIASGYNHYFAKDDFDDFGMIPLAGYVRYYFTPSGLFFGGDVGYGFLTNVDNNSGGLYLSPQIGYHNDDWNIYGYYQHSNTENDFKLQSVGLGVTYNIRFK